MRTRYSAILMFKASLLLLIILLGGLAFSGCYGVATVPKGWSGGAIADSTLFIGSMEGKLVAVNTSDGSRLWAEPLKAPESSGGGFGCAPASTVVAIYGSPAVVEGEGLVCVGGYNGKIYTISISTRLSKDKYLNEKDRKPIIGGPLVAGGTVYIGSSDGLVYALDAISLDEKWKFRTGDKIWSTPAVNEDTLYIGSFDKKLYALNATDGVKKWEFKTEGAIVSTPVIYNNTVYFGSFDRYFYAIDATSGSLKWKFLAENWFWAKPVVYNDTIYAGCLDGKVYILDAKGGNKLAEPLDLGSPVSSSPVLVGNLIIVTTQEGVIYAIDTSTNQEKWKNEDLKEKNQKIYASLCTGEGKVYIHTTTGELHVLNAQSGAKLWSLSLKSK